MQQDDGQEVAASSNSAAHSPLSPLEIALFRENIHAVEAARVGRRDRLLAFAMARHQRLGLNSPAYGVSRDVCSVIASFVPGVRVMVAGGLLYVREDEDRYFEQEATTAVSISDMLGRDLQVIEPLPVAISQATLLQYQKRDEIWCVGGRSQASMSFLTSAFVYSLRTRSWRTVENVFKRERIGGKFVIYKNSLLSFGGWCPSSEGPCPDDVYTIDGKPRWPRGLPKLIEENQVGGNALDLILIKDLLVVRFSESVSLLYDEHPQDHAFYIDLRSKAPKWKPFPGWQADLIQVCWTVFDGNLLILGGQLDSGCPTCSVACDKTLRFDFATSRFEEMDSLLAERVMQSYPVFSEFRGGGKKLMLIGGWHLVNYGDSEGQFLPLEMGKDGKWRQLKTEKFPAQKLVGAGLLQLSM